MTREPEKYGKPKLQTFRLMETIQWFGLFELIAVAVGMLLRESRVMQVSWTFNIWKWILKVQFLLTSGVKWPQLQNIEICELRVVSLKLAIVLAEDK